MAILVHKVLSLPRLTQLLTPSNPGSGRGWLSRGGGGGGVSISNCHESVEEPSSPELEFKSQILRSDIGLLLSLKVVRLRSDI